MCKIQTRPDTYQTGWCLDGRQVIMGMYLYPWVVAVFFDTNGILLEVQERSLDLKTKPEDWYDIAFQSRLGHVLRSWQRELGFKEATVTVKPFFLKDFRIGTQELPLDCEDFMQHPQDYSKEDKEEFLRDIEQWRREGNFVFWWNANYHLDKDGETI